MLPRYSATGVAPIGALILALSIAACRSPRDFADPASGDPQARLALLLRAWHESRDVGTGCAGALTLDTPLVDCDRLRLQIERLTVEFPTDPDVLLASAVVAFEAGRRESAEKDLDALRRLDPLRTEAALLRARIALEEGNLRLARRVLEDQIELVPDRASLYELLASVAYLEDRWPEARSALEAAFRLGGPASRIAYHHGLVFEAEGRAPEAAEAYRTCLELDSEFAPAQTRLRALAASAGLDG